MALRDTMTNSARPFLKPGEQIQAVIGAQTASQYVAALAGVFFFLGLNRYRILVATSERILVLDAGKMSMKKAQGVITELPRSTRLGPGNGLWHVIMVNGEKLRVHRRFFKDIEASDSVLRVV
jgi:hypothetical protein